MSPGGRPRTNTLDQWELELDRAGIQMPDNASPDKVGKEAEEDAREELFAAI